MEYFVIKTSGGENCTVGCVDEAGRGVEVYRGCTDHVLKKKVGINKHFEHYGHNS